MARYVLKYYSSKAIELSKPNSSILVFKIPYAELKNAQAVAELKIENRFVIYILHNTANKIYVGKSKNGIVNRPKAHEDRAVWNDCYILTNFKERTFFNDGTIQYIEDKLCKRFSELDRYTNTTKVTSTNTANANDEEDCDEYIEEAVKMLYALGLDMSERKEDAPTEAPIGKYTVATPMAPLFAKIKEELLKVNSDIREEHTATYIKFMLDKEWLLNLETTNTEVKILFNARTGQLQDDKGLLEDVSKIGRHGSGEYRLCIKDDTLMADLRDFVNQIINL